MANRGSFHEVVGRWAALTIAVLCVTTLFTDTRRWEGPIEEKYVNIYQPGGADFVAPYLAARALLRGADPYLHQLSDLDDPYGRDKIPVEGKYYRLLYGPTHALMYVPLAYLFGPNWTLAARVWYCLNLLWVALLSFVTFRIASIALGRSLVLPSLFAWVCMFVLSLNPGTQLLFERGQSELFGALLCWSALLLAVRDRYFVAMFLMTWATLIKGYPLLTAAGLGVFGLSRRRTLATISGGALAVALLLLPVIRYVPTALEAMRGRSHFFWAFWMNHSFRNLVSTVAPMHVDAGSRVLVAYALVCTLLTFAYALYATRRGDEGTRCAAFVSFGFTATATVIAYSWASFAYNLVMIFPGALILATAQRSIVARLGGRALLTTLVGGWSLTFAFLLFICRIVSFVFPTASLGILGFCTLSAFLAVVALVRAVRARSWAQPQVAGHGQIV